jgi:predicted component of type VI protein secretion system
MSEAGTAIAPRDERGRWVKGSGGNPGGRTSAEKKELRAYAREFSKEAIDGLVSVLRDEKASEVAKVRAAEVLLDRGFGKAPVEVNVNADEELTALLAGLEIDNSGLRLLAAAMASARPAITVESRPVVDDEGQA